MLAPFVSHKNLARLIGGIIYIFQLSQNILCKSVISVVAYETGAAL